MRTVIQFSTLELALELFHSLSEIKSGAPTMKSGLGEGFCGLVLS